MAALSDSTGSGGGGGGRAGAELMVPQFHLKALHAILAVRAPRSIAAAPAPASAAFRRRDRWFHLPLHAPPPPAAAEHIPEPSPAEPLVVDVYLAPSGGGGEEEVVERWTVACEPWPSGARAAAVAGEGLALNRAYKRCITLLRSVYTALRILPAYRVFRRLCKSSQSYNYEMGYRVGSFAAPFSRTEESAMRTCRFSPVETQLGRLVVSVQYLPSLANYNLQISPVIIPYVLLTEYVGSLEAEPMRPFPASLTEPAGSAFPPPSRRPNSWASPAPWPQALGEQVKFSPPLPLYASPTPSPPTFAGSYLQSRLSGETAPMSIPQPGGGRGPVQHRNMSDPSRGFMLPPPSPKSVRGEAVVHESPTETSRSFRRAEGLRMADLSANLPAALKIKDLRDESGRFSGVLSSSGSPRLGISRSSSRFSMQDDTDDTDFPFAVDDIDTPNSRPGSSGGKDVGDQAGSSSHKSQVAAVGYLIHLLRSARPLRDPSNSSHTSMAESTEAGSTSSFMSRRTSDAFEELESFKEIRENVLARSRSRLQDSIDGS